MTTSFEVVFSTKFSNGKTLGRISIIGLGMYCFKVSVAANHRKLGGVITDFGLSKVVNKQIRSDSGVHRHTSLAQLGGL